MTMNLKDDIVQRIDELLDIASSSFTVRDEISELAFGAVALVGQIYGEHSVQANHVAALQKQEVDTYDISDLIDLRIKLKGCLRALKAEVVAGRIVDIQSEARGEVFGDFIVLARRALDDGAKDVAAVLACAALEDSLKQCAKRHGHHFLASKMLVVERSFFQFNLASPKETTNG